MTVNERLAVGMDTARTVSQAHVPVAPASSSAGDFWGSVIHSTQ